MAGMIKTPSRSFGLRGRTVRGKYGKALPSAHVESGAGRTSPFTLSQALKRRSSKPAGVQGSKPLRVMIADDDHRVLGDVEAILSEAGMKVCKVDNPYEIRSRVGTFRPQVLILDEYFVNSGIDFRRVMSNVVQAYPRLKVVVTTGGRVGKHSAGAPEVWGARGVHSGGGVPDSQELLKAVREAVPQ